MLALGDPLRPTITHIGPQGAGQQKAGCHRFPLAHTAVGIDQGRVNKDLLGPFDHHVQQRINTPRHAQVPELGNRGQRMAGLQQFEHFVKQAALWHIGQQLLRLD